MRLLKFHLSRFNLSMSRHVKLDCVDTRTRFYLKSGIAKLIMLAEVLSGICLLCVEQ